MAKDAKLSAGNVRVFGRIKKLLGREEPPLMMAMFRVHQSDGSLANKVHLRATFQPRGGHVAGPRLTAHGVCMLHWAREAQYADVVLTCNGEEAHVTVRRDRPEPSRVIPVHLTPAADAVPEPSANVG